MIHLKKLLVKQNLIITNMLMKISFFQFMHDSAALINEDKHQAFRIQFKYSKFRHNSVIVFSFRKPLSHEAEKVTELAEEACTEYFDLEFNDVFSSSV